MRNLDEIKSTMSSIRNINHDVMAKEQNISEAPPPTVVALTKIHEECNTKFKELAEIIGKMPAMMNRLSEQTAAIDPVTEKQLGPKPIASIDYQVAVTDAQSLLGDLGVAIAKAELEAMEFGARNNVVMGCCNAK